MRFPATLLSSRLRQRLFRERAVDVLPLTIRHQRIYILPTRQGWVFLLALMLMLVASVNYALSLGYALCFLLSGLFTASLLATYRNLAGLRLHGIQAGEVECGQPARFVITVGNGERMHRQDLCFTAAGGVARTSVDAGSEATAELRVPTRRRGRLRLGRVTIYSDYPLGLWRTWCYVHSPASLVVLPRAEQAPPLAPATIGNDPGDVHHRGEQGDVAGLREYRPGDTLSSIAWKAVARGRGLVVREFDTPAAHGGDLDLSLESTGLTDREAQVARLAAWIRQAHDNGIGVRLTLPGETLATDAAEHADSTAPLRRLALFDEQDRAA